MKKKTLENKIKDIGKYLDSEKAKTAIADLMQEVKNYVEPTNDAPSSGDFVLPKEISTPGAVAVFTDGACRGNPGPGAYGFMIQDQTGAVVAEGSDIATHTTNNKMELMGVIKGLEMVQDALPFANEIYVYTDSKYVVDGINSWVAGWKRRGWKKADNKVPENIDLWKSLDMLATQMSPKFNWVKGHAGHPQNEYVDQLANIALDKNGY